MKPRILFIVQLPPPVHGVTIMNKFTVEHPWWKRDYEAKTLPLHFGQRLEDIGKITPGKLFHMIGFVFRLCATMIRFKPSLVYFTIVPTGKIFYRDALFTWVIKLFNPKIVFHLHKKGVEEIVRKSSFKRWLYKRTFNGVNAICLSEKLTQDIRSVYPRKPFILPNGIPVMHQLSITHDNKVPHIIFLSNLLKAKGIEVFLQSLAELRRQNCEFTASIVGEAFDYPIAKVKTFCKRQGLADRVEVTGPKYDDEKYAILQRSDIFVLPSYDECVPLTILEAMQSRLAIVTTHVGGIPDMITHGVNGFLIKPGSERELTARLRQLINDKNLRIQLGDNAYRRFLQQYTLKNFYDGLHHIFEDVLHDKKEPTGRVIMIPQKQNV